jgi:hypothetical protein
LIVLAQTVRDALSRPLSIYTNVSLINLNDQLKADILHHISCRKVYHAFITDTIYIPYHQYWWEVEWRIFIFFNNTNNKKNIFRNTADNHCLADIRALCLCLCSKFNIDVCITFCQSIWFEAKLVSRLALLDVIHKVYIALEL